MINFIDHDELWKSSNVLENPATSVVGSSQYTDSCIVIGSGKVII